MNLQTKIALSKQSDSLIGYESKVLLLGSCFVENIGDKLAYFKFQNTINPFGILFHPKAIETLVIKALKEKNYTSNDIFFNREQWHSFDAHSKFSNSVKEELLDKLNAQISLTNKQIHESTHIIITLGTAWVYKHIDSGKFVANCHKVPQKQFKKELLSVGDIVASLQNIVNAIRTVNPKVSFLFTVSPVRHIKDGFIENTRSKAHLISAIHEFLNNHKSLSGVEAYFPSYEIMMDELRDYRFYKEDMIHPNQTAVNYIWERFNEVWVSSEASKIMGEVDTIQKGLAHRPFNPHSKAHLQFLKKLEVKISELQSKYSHITF